MRRSGVRIPLAPPQADIRSGCRFFVCLGAVLRCLSLCCLGRRWCSRRRVAYLDGPGRCVCRWAAARPRDRHTRACGSEWSFSKPALALPPPTGTAARLSGALHTGGIWRAGIGRTMPRHRPRAPRPCPPVPPAPSTPVAQPEFAIELVACGSAGVPGAFGPGRPRG